MTRCPGCSGGPTSASGLSELASAVLPEWPSGESDTLQLTACRAEYYESLRYAASAPDHNLGHMARRDGRRPEHEKAKDFVFQSSSAHFDSAVVVFPLWCFPLCHLIRRADGAAVAWEVVPLTHQNVVSAERPCWVPLLWQVQSRWGSPSGCTPHRRAARRSASQSTRWRRHTWWSQPPRRCARPMASAPSASSSPGSM